MILASGLKMLNGKKKLSFEEYVDDAYGNYLISDKSAQWSYVGEAKSLSKRIKQHSREKSSTFYKNYTKLLSSINNNQGQLDLTDFKVQAIGTMVGRKEMEEFSIMNLPTNLNRFQKGKRSLFTGSVQTNIWNEIQPISSMIIDGGEIEISNSKNYQWFNAEVENKPGLYWIEHNSDGLIYIGESSNIFNRYVTHSKTTYFSALRRHIGENILGFELQTIKNKKRYFDAKEDPEVTNYLKKCTIRSVPVKFGRYELEEYLIRKFKPLLNRKENK